MEMKGIYQKQSGLHNMLGAFKLKSQFCSGHWLTTTLYSDQVSCTHPWMQEHTVTCVLYLNRKVILLFYFLSKMLSNCLHHRNFFLSLFWEIGTNVTVQLLQAVQFLFRPQTLQFPRDFLAWLVWYLITYVCKLYTFLTFHLMWPYVIYGTIRIMSLNINCLLDQKCCLPWNNHVVFLCRNFFQLIRTLSRRQRGSEGTTLVLVFVFIIQDIVALSNFKLFVWPLKKKIHNF